jgi:GTP-binding protein HflX
VGGIGVRGEGETQLEIDRRLVHRRILRLRTELRRIDRSRAERGKRRRATFQVALVGYTNAGKTTLFNALTGASGAVEDRLFATLDPLVRPLGRPGRRRVLLIDTVGFVRKLPHALVASFRSTLREAARADLLLHVIDVSHPAYEEQAETARQVLAELELSKTPMLEVFTKVDRVQEPGVLARAARLYPEARSVSAVREVGLAALAARIQRAALEGTVEERISLPAGDAAAMARLRREVDILETVYRGSRVEVRYRVEPDRAARARRRALGEGEE